jgi:hypothetical protein
MATSEIDLTAQRILAEQRVIYDPEAQAYQVQGETGTYQVREQGDKLVCDCKASGMGTKRCSHKVAIELLLAGWEPEEDVSDACGETVYERLLAVQRGVDKFTKRRVGAVKYAFVGSDQVLGRVRVLMNEQRLLCIPEVTAARFHPEAAHSGKSHLIELDLRFEWIAADHPESRHSVTFYGIGVDTGEQAVGKALTYAEKYLMLKTFHVATDGDDPDEIANRPQGGNGQTQASPTGYRKPLPPRPQETAPQAQAPHQPDPEEELAQAARAQAPQAAAKPPVTPQPAQRLNVGGMTEAHVNELKEALKDAHLGVPQMKAYWATIGRRVETIMDSWYADTMGWIYAQGHPDGRDTAAGYLAYEARDGNEKAREILDGLGIPWAEGGTENGNVRVAV